MGVLDSIVMIVGLMAVRKVYDDMKFKHDHEHIIPQNYRAEVKVAPRVEFNVSNETKSVLLFIGCAFGFLLICVGIYILVLLPPLMSIAAASLKNSASLTLTSAYSSLIWTLGTAWSISWWIFIIVMIQLIILPILHFFGAHDLIEVVKYLSFIHDVNEHRNESQIVNCSQCRVFTIVCLIIMMHLANYGFYGVIYFLGIVGIL